MHAHETAKKLLFPKIGHSQQVSPFTAMLPISDMLNPTKCYFKLDSTEDVHPVF